ncbi:MAG: hypothetical protein PHN75_10085, partial [Syntrophales bacterium]|nr:hypothetical protein [Syntrophales bacterium]
TIMSRCQFFDFHRISLIQIALNLRKIADAEGIRITDAGLSWIAEAGDGSMRDSESVFDQVISYAGMEISDRDIEEILGRSDRRFLFQISAAVFRRDPAECLTIIDEAYYAGIDMQSFYQMILQHFRNLLLCKIVGESEDILQIGEEDRVKLKEQSVQVSLDTLQLLLDTIMAEEDNMRRSRHPRINLEAVLVRMAYLEPLIPIDQILSRMESLEKRISEKKAAPRVNEPAVYQNTQTISSGKGPTLPVNEPAVSPYHVSPEADAQDNGSISATAPLGGPLPASMEAMWDSFKDHIRKVDPRLNSKIEPGKLLSYENDILRIGCPKNHYDLFIAGMDSPQREVLDAEIRSFLKKEKLTIRIEPVADEGGNGVKDANGALKNGELMEKRREIMKHPAIQKILDVFEGAEVKEVIARRRSEG